MGQPQPEGSAKLRAVSCSLIGCQAGYFRLSQLYVGSIASRRGVLQLRPRARDVGPVPTDSPNPAKIRPRPATHTPQILPKNTKAPLRAGLSL